MTLTFTFQPLHPKKRLTLSPVHSDDTISKDSHLADTVQFCEPNSDDSFSIASLDSLVTDEIGLLRDLFVTTLSTLSIIFLNERITSSLFVDDMFSRFL